MGTATRCLDAVFFVFLLSRAGDRKAPRFPCFPSEEAPSVGKPMLPTEKWILV